MTTRKLYRLREDFHNPNGDRRVANDVNRLPKIPKGTFVVERVGSDFFPWAIIGYGSPSPRRELIESLVPFLEEVEILTFEDVAMLFREYKGGPGYFVQHLIKGGRVTIAEYAEFLQTTCGDEKRAEPSSLT